MHSETNKISNYAEMKNNLIEPVPTEARELFGSSFSQIEYFAQMLYEEGELRGLIGPRELPRLWTRHLINSTAVEPFMKENKTVADLGSGAGFPGIVLAIMRPDLEITLIEPMGRRCEWLSDVTTEVGLDNVRILQIKAHEIHGRETFDYVTSRAVAALYKIIGWSLPLLNQRGKLVAIKGAKATEEITEAEKYIKRYKTRSVELKKVSRPGHPEPANVVVIEKQ